MSSTTYDTIGSRIVPVHADTDDVRWALETALAMLQGGDAREALRWLRRAAETAAEEGLDLRAVQLATTAADLRAQLDLPPTSPPPPANPPPAEPRSAAEPVTSSAPLPHSYADPPQRFVDTSPGLSPVYDGRASSTPPPQGERAADTRAPAASRASAALSALRVAVERTDDGTLKVTVLAAGEPVPSHAYEAVLVALSPGVAL